MCNADEMAAAKEHLTSMGEDTSDLKPENAVSKLIAHGKKMKDAGDGMKMKHEAAKAVMALSADAELEPAGKKLKTDLEAEKAKVVSLSAGDPAALTPWNLSAFEMNADSLREAAIRNGRVSAADAKSFTSLWRGKDGKPTRTALSASCDNGHPTELNFWRIVANMAEPIKIDKSGGAVDPATALDASATREGVTEEKMRPEMVQRMQRNLGLPVDMTLK